MGDAARKKTSVLVVDDSVFDRQLAGAILAKENAEPLYAEDGARALELLASARPDVVLTDLQMPMMDGLILVREIKRLYSSVPVILMTGQGSEEIAAEALRSGASSYVPKRNLNRDLGVALSMVLTAIESHREREQVHDFVDRSDIRFRLGYEPSGPKVLVNHLQETLGLMKICDHGGRLRVGTALVEAIVNAIDHGNLELDSKLREEDGNQYRKLGQERMTQSPYRDRRVIVSASFTPDEAVFVIKDEGPGFDPGNLPDPTDPLNLIRPFGRGVMLIRTFMDDVRFNDRANEITLVKRKRKDGG
jgi:CheY-like chemotaxis protein